MRVSLYTREQILNRANPSNVSAAAAAFGGNEAQGYRQDSERANQRYNQLGQIGQQHQRELEIERQQRTYDYVNERQRERIIYEDEKRNEHMSKPTGYADVVDKWYADEEKRIQTTVSDGNADLDLGLARRLLGSSRNQSLERNRNWESETRFRNLFVRTEGNLEGMSLNYALETPTVEKFGQQVDKTRDYIRDVGSGVFGEPDQQKLLEASANDAFRITIDSELQNDPEKIDYILNYGRGGRDAVINFVIDQIEGGDKIAQEPKGGIAKFGINSNANPDVDVRSLTRDQALEIYGNRYWDKSLDKMPPAMQAVAFDTMVNHGVQTAKKMIKEADGSPYALIELRRAEYKRLAAENPEEYAGNLRGWDNRLGRLTKFADSVGDTGQKFLQYAGIVDPAQMQYALNQIPAARAARQRQEALEAKKRIDEYGAMESMLVKAQVTNLERTSEAELQQLKQLAHNTQEPEIIKRYQTFEDTRNYVSALRNLGEKQLTAQIRSLNTQINKEPTESLRFMLKVTEDVLANYRTGVKEDGLAFFANTGMVRMPQNIPFQDGADGVAAEIIAREKAAATVFENTGEEVSLLTPQEAEEFVAVAQNLNARDLAGLLKTFDSVSVDSRARIAKQIDKKDKVLSAAMMVDDVEDKRRLLLGRKLEARYDKDSFESIINPLLDSMFASPNEREAALQAVTAHYRALGLEAGDFGNVDVTKMKKRVKRSLEAVYAPVIDLYYGASGDQKVFSFKDDKGAWVDEDALYDIFSGIKDYHLRGLNKGNLPTDSQGRTIDADELDSDAVVHSVGRGKYRISINGASDINGEILAHDGNPFVIDARELMKMQKRLKK